ncbi:MAG: hypothetical protein EOO61_02240 [Hymenobacter sp.]|nr:MAG: hypothetical protein EOO61_02240 [Hymenobacter sp.]
MKKTIVLLLFSVLASRSFGQVFGSSAPPTTINRREVTTFITDSTADNRIFNAKATTRAIYDIAGKIAGVATAIDSVVFTNATTLSYTLTPDRVKKFGSSNTKILDYKVIVAGVEITPYAEKRPGSLYFEFGNTPLSGVLYILPGVGRASIPQTFPNLDKYVEKQSNGLLRSLTLVTGIDTTVQPNGQLNDQNSLFTILDTSRYITNSVGGRDYRVFTINRDHDGLAIRNFTKGFNFRNAMGTASIFHLGQNGDVDIMGNTTIKGRPVLGLAFQDKVDYATNIAGAPTKLSEFQNDLPAYVESESAFKSSYWYNKNGTTLLPNSISGNAATATNSTKFAGYGLDNTQQFNEGIEGIFAKKSNEMTLRVITPTGTFNYVKPILDVNYVSSNGSYTNPGWLISIPYSKISNPPTPVTKVSQLTQDVPETDLTVPAYSKSLNSFDIIKSSTDPLYAAQTGYFPNLNAGKFSGYTLDNTKAYNEGLDYLFGRTANVQEQRLLTPTAVYNWLLPLLPSKLSQFQNDLNLTISTISGLQPALDGKQSVLSTGTAGQYRKGDHSLGTFATDVVSAQAQPDWNATSGKSQILNKPVIPTAAQIGIRFSKQVTVNSTTNTVSFFHNQSGVSASSLIFITVRSEFGKSPAWIELTDQLVTIHYDYTLSSGNTITYNTEIIP